MNRRKHWNCEGLLWWAVGLDAESLRRLNLKDQAFKEKR
jgi:hypothetical protein